MPTPRTFHLNDEVHFSTIKGDRSRGRERSARERRKRPTDQSRSNPKTNGCAQVCILAWQTHSLCSQALRGECFMKDSTSNLSLIPQAPHVLSLCFTSRSLLHYFQ